MLRANFVKCAFVRPFEYGPEGFDAVGVDHPLYIFTHTMPNRRMLTVHSFVGRSVVGEHIGGFCRVVLDKVMQRLGVRAFDDLCHDLIGIPIFSFQ